MHGRLIESVYSLCAYCFVHVSGMAKNGSTTRVQLERVGSQALRGESGGCWMEVYLTRQE